MWKRLGRGGAALALALAAGGASAAGQAQGLLRLCRPERRRRLDASSTTSGRQRVEKELGDKVETDLRRERAGRPGRRARHRAPRARRLQAHLHHLVRLHGPDAQGRREVPGREVRARHRLQDAPTTSTTYNARFYEGRYIIGQIAAKMSKTGVAGYIVSFPIPEVVMGINSFMLGAQSVNPDFKVKIVWVNSWFDPGKEGDAAKALFDQGVDIIAQHTDSTGAAADRRGARAARLRPVARHDQVRAEGAAHRRSSTTGARTTSRASRRCSTAPGSRRRAGTASRTGTVMMAPYTNMPDDVEGDGRGHRRPRSSPASCIRSPARSPSRTARKSAEPARSLDDGDAARHELLRQGRRRQAAAIAAGVAVERTDGRAPIRGAPVSRLTAACRTMSAFLVDWLNLARPLGPPGRRHRLDRHVVLFHRARPQPAQARAA